MEKQSPKQPEESSMSRRDALCRMLAGGATLISAFTPLSIHAEESDKLKIHIDFNDLPKDEEYVYLLLFENNPNDKNTSDDFIVDATQTMGYGHPNYWHSEVAYYDKDKEEWMAAGCRPPTCSGDFPVSQLKRDLNFKGYKVSVRQLHVPLEQREQALQWFKQHLQGQPYNLAGPLLTNCTDAVVALGQQGNVKGAQGIRYKTRDEIKNRSGIAGFLDRWKKASVDDILHRDSIVFPDELEKVGKHIGTMQF
jgi:hypothetical protein